MWQLNTSYFNPYKNSAFTMEREKCRQRWRICPIPTTTKWQSCPPNGTDCEPVYFPCCVTALCPSDNLSLDHLHFHQEHIQKVKKEWIPASDFRGLLGVCPWDGSLIRRTALVLDSSTSIYGAHPSSVWTSENDNIVINHISLVSPFLTYPSFLEFSSCRAMSLRSSSSLLLLRIILIPP